MLRQSVARQTWQRQRWLELPVADNKLRRLFRERDRALPYVKDLFDIACDTMPDPDIVVYTNADICVRADCCARVAALLQGADAAWAYRRDFNHELRAPLPDQDIVKGHFYPGSDLYAFRVGWWRKHRHHMPDMILGRELWDPCLRLVIERTNPGREVELKDLIYHQRHDSFWERRENRYALPGQIYNLKTGASWLRANGVDPAVHGVPATF